MVMAVSSGGPRVGNAAFRRRLEESGGKVLRIVNSLERHRNQGGHRDQGAGVPVDDDCCIHGGEPAKRIARVPRWLAFSDVATWGASCC
ncbi:hypothetical protein BAE44_0007231 [Dichanthelium oligosanthes]|uniref:Fungal lipase-like domain-containing protein n=1 Tax=Dichanthelium oligosanthes TaxID=888268 RepID=A0A1E5W379_9POAL|nr:hypothetical protein BAE44_0007231 [Dichanthelium oligosanthes]